MAGLYTVLDHCEYIYPPSSTTAPCPVEGRNVKSHIVSRHWPILKTSIEIYNTCYTFKLDSYPTVDRDFLLAFVKTTDNFDSDCARCKALRSRGLTEFARGIVDLELMEME
jgi:hypothetical protein